MKSMVLIFLAAVLLVAPLACVKPFGTSPLSPAVATVTFSPTATPKNSPTPSSTVTATGTISTTTPTSTTSNSPTSTVTTTPPASLSSTATATVTSTSTTGSPCSTVTTLNFTGNLNSAQAATSPGGVLNLGTSSSPIMPLALPGVLFNTVKLNIGTYGSGNALFQVADLTTPLDTQAPALANHTTPLVFGAVDEDVALVTSKSIPSSTFAWDQSPVIPAGVTVIKSLTDVAGNPRQVTFLFYQVNDIGTASPAVNPNPPHQAAWAWYAFDTTGGKAPNTTTLIEGTDIVQCSFPFISNYLPSCFADRGVAGDGYSGDLIYFNSDGSLASEGAVRYTGSFAVQAKPQIILPPLGGWPSIPPRELE
jgi:hypothetical protein